MSCTKPMLQNGGSHIRQSGGASRRSIHKQRRVPLWKLAVLSCCCAAALLERGAAAALRRPHQHPRADLRYNQPIRLRRATRCF